MILEKNEFIANFMKWKYHSNTANHGIRDNSWESKDHKIHYELLFHDSWDWLMPVWREVINVIGLYMSTHEDVNIAKLWLTKGEEIETDIITVNINGAFNKIYNLIKWYNHVRKY